MYQSEPNQRKLQRLLTIGFVLVIGLLIAEGFLGVRSMLSIRSNAARIIEGHYLLTSLIDEVQREQDTLSAVFYVLAGDPDSLDRVRLLRQIDTVEESVRKIVAAAPARDSDQANWKQLLSASAAFSEEARRLLTPEHPSTVYSRELLRRHEEVVSTVARLVRDSHKKAAESIVQIETRSSNQIRKSVLLLGGCLVVACVCAFLVLRAAAALHRRMAEQADELSRVSWQLLENQEITARRLSHELHDELGQALTALKASFARHSSAACADPGWVQDCTKLLKESIQSAHEISQLLRPTILDDFGLDSALAWLCERFGERTGIEIEYSSSFTDRLPEETETHLFRIAQEALTNVARHSGATLVQMGLGRDNDGVLLSIRDNGKGLPPPKELRQGGQGLTGMRARARSANGALTVRTGDREGVTIEAWVPLEKRRDAEKDPYLVG